MTADTEDTGRASAFVAPYATPDEEIAARLLTAVPRAAAAETRIDARARSLIEGIRAHAGGLGGIEDFLHAYSLSTKEGLALMVLAEALLRVPDAATADRLIEDKLATGDWPSADALLDASVAVEVRRGDIKGLGLMTTYLLAEPAG